MTKELFVYLIFTIVFAVFDGGKLFENRYAVTSNPKRCYKASVVEYLIVLHVMTDTHKQIKEVRDSCVCWAPNSSHSGVKHV